MRILTTTLMLAVGLLTFEATAQVESRGDLPSNPSRFGRLPDTFEFGARQHLDKLAENLRRHMKTACLEMHYHYQENDGFRATYAETYTMWKLSEHVHALIHDEHGPVEQSDRDRVAADLEKLDALFHHVEEDISNWRPSHRIGRGHDLHALMDEAEDSLHDMMDDYGKRSRYRRYSDADPPVPERAGRPRR